MLATGVRRHISAMGPRTTVDKVSGVDPMAKLGSNGPTPGRTIAVIGAVVGGKFVGQSSRNRNFIEPVLGGSVTAVGGQTGDVRFDGQYAEKPKLGGKLGAGGG